jgi:hypothetical protein
VADTHKVTIPSLFSFGTWKVAITLIENKFSFLFYFIIIIMLPFEYAVAALQVCIFSYKKVQIKEVTCKKLFILQQNQCSASFLYAYKEQLTGLIMGSEKIV